MSHATASTYKGFMASEAVVCYDEFMKPQRHPLKKAIDAGRLKPLKEWLELRKSATRPSWMPVSTTEDPTLVPCDYDEDEEEQFNPLHRALAKEKTNAVFLLLEHGWQVTPEVENNLSLFGEFRPEGQLTPQTNQQATFQAIMRYVRSKYMFHPLPPRQRAQLVQLRDALVKEEGPTQVLLRTLHTPADWLGWVPALVKEGASPNTHTLHPDNGMTLHALTLAGTNGMRRDMEALLAAGANPLWKQHNWTTPAHTVADLAGQANMVLSTRNMINLDVVKRRKDCLDLLLAQPGVKAATDFHGRTASDIWQASLQILADGWKGPTDKTPEAQRAAFREKLFTLSITDATPAAPGQRHRF